MPVFAQESTPQADDRESRSFLFHPADTGLLTVFEAEINAGDATLTPYFGQYAAEKAKALKAHPFDRGAIASRGLNY